MKLFYDGACGFCKVCVALLLRWDRWRRLDPIAIQDPEGQRLLAPIPEAERLRSAHVMAANGEILSGAEGAPALLRQLPAGRPLAALLAIAMPLTRLVYRLVTAARPAIGWILPAAWRRWASGLIAERRRGQDGLSRRAGAARACCR
jgi:predicted DCC family thiol-disulfide oxidoreductase YuxK